MPPKLNQIVGHTPHNKPQIHKGLRGIRHGLDTHLHHYGILEDGKLMVLEVER
jgi:hypothetical protein